MNWYVMLVGDGFALSIYPKDDTYESARQFVLNWLGVSRLPKGTEIWKG